MRNNEKYQIVSLRMPPFFNVNDVYAHNVTNGVAWWRCSNKEIRILVKIDGMYHISLSCVATSNVKMPLYVKR